LALWTPAGNYNNIKELTRKARCDTNKLHCMQGMREVHFVVLLMYESYEIADDMKDRKLLNIICQLHLATYMLLVPYFRRVILDIHDVTFKTGFGYPKNVPV
jgi:hypothetical protein